MIVTLENRCSFAIEIGEPLPESRELRQVDLWAASEWLTCDDNLAYVPQFVHSLSREVGSAAGVFVRGFDHESPMSPFANDGDVWPGLLDGIPEVFAAQVSEPAFSDGETLAATFCLWRQASDDRWHTGSIDFPVVAGFRHDPDGSGMLKILCDSAGSAYQAFAADYYETELDLAAVAHVYAGQPLDEYIVRQLNPALTLADIADEIRDLGKSPYA